MDKNDLNNCFILLKNKVEIDKFKKDFYSKYNIFYNKINWNEMIKYNNLDFIFDRNLNKLIYYQRNFMNRITGNLNEKFYSNKHEKFYIFLNIVKKNDYYMLNCPILLKVKNYNKFKKNKNIIDFNIFEDFYLNNEKLLMELTRKNNEFINKHK